MILPSIETPADLQNLSYEELDELSEEIRQFIIETVTNNPTGGHLGSNLGVVELTLALHRVFESPEGHHLVGHRPPGLRPQTADRSALRLQEPAPARRPVGLPEPLGEPARLDRVQPRLDRALLRARPLGRARTAQGTHRSRRQAPRRGGRRRRFAHRRHGLRGAQQPRPLQSARRHRLERQRAQLRPHHLQALGVPDVAAPQQDVPHVARSSAPHGAAPAQGRQGRLPGHRRAYVGRARDGHAAHVLREPRRALHRSDRRSRHRVDGEHAEERRAVGRADPRPRPDDQGPRLRTRDRRRHEDARLQAAAASRRRRGRAAVVLPGLLRRTGRPGERRRARRRDHRGDGRSDGSAQLSSRSSPTASSTSASPSNTP